MEVAIIGVGCDCVSDGVEIVSIESCIDGVTGVMGAGVEMLLLTVGRAPVFLFPSMTIFSSFDRIFWPVKWTPYSRGG